jgi:CBS domain-containing protein
MVTVSDVLATLAHYPVARSKLASETGEDTVRSIMSSNPMMAHPDDSVMLAAARMARAGVRHLCVVDGEHRILGIVSDRDLRSAVGDPRRVLAAKRLPESLANLRIQAVMMPEPRTLQPDEPVSAALEAFLTQRVGALPVTEEDGRVLGIVSYMDVLRHLADRLS